MDSYSKIKQKGSVNMKVILIMVDKIISTGIKTKDSYHVACAISACYDE